MKAFCSLALFILILSFVGCKEQTTSSIDDATFEKRIPIGTNDSIKKDSIKTNRKMRVEAVVSCINLTREQDSIIRRFILESKRCEIECKKQFNTSVNDLRKEYDSKLNAYKGTSKDSLAKKDIEIIKFKFRQNLRELEKQYQAKLIECKKLLYLNIESNLNEKQLILWNIWKATGKIPCEIKP
jgi:hypothetical protein